MTTDIYAHGSVIKILCRIVCALIFINQNITSYINCVGITGDVNTCSFLTNDIKILHCHCQAIIIAS